MEHGEMPHSLAVTLLPVPMSERVDCHVCGAVGRDLFPGPPPPTECQPEPDLGLPRECPPNHKGCLTTFDGKRYNVFLHS